MSVYEDVRLDGHIIDSLMLPLVLNDILALEGEYHILDITVGHEREDVSTAILRVEGQDGPHLEALLERIQGDGATALVPGDARYVPGGCGEAVVVGREGIRVVPLARPRTGAFFEFMSSPVSSERPKALVLEEVTRLGKETRAAGKTIVAVVGPAVVHTGAAPALARLVREGWIDVLFGGNAIATHDIESALFGTSMGVDLAQGLPVHGGNEHNLRAINRVRAAGSIWQAVERGVLTSGIFFTGNLLPAAVHTVCVDINPAVVTKFTDRGSIQTIGSVTDVGLFLDELANEPGPAARG